MTERGFVIIESVEQFLKQAFEANPSYSFDDPDIMIRHAMMVRDIALKIENEVHCDRSLLEVMALFHDIGKAYAADQETLRKKHAELGYEVTKDFLPTLKLSEEDLECLENFLKGDMTSLHAQIVKDADVIAFFADPILQVALKNWGEKNDLPHELQRKADRIETLTFETSKQIARPLYDQMVAKWRLDARYERR